MTRMVITTHQAQTDSCHKTRIWATNLPHVWQASPLASHRDLIALITSGEEQNIYYEEFSNEKKSPYEPVEGSWRFVWNGLERSPTALNHDTWNVKRLGSKTTTTTWLLPAGGAGSSASEPSSTHAKTRPMSAKRICVTKSGVRACGTFKTNVQLTTTLPEFHILLDGGWVPTFRRNRLAAAAVVVVLATKARGSLKDPNDT
jgi:hypothetical protein